MGLTVIVAGNAGAGKTVVVNWLMGKIAERGVELEFMSDRLLLEEAVLRDVEGGLVDEEGQRGAHSILVDGNRNPGSRVVHVTDGYLLNEVHDLMAREALNHGVGVMVQEVAIGRNNDGFETGPPLLHDGESLLSRLANGGGESTNLVVIVELEAGVKARFERNLARGDEIEEKTFRAYFEDAVPIVELDPGLIPEGVTYIHIDNGHSDIEALWGEMESVWEGQLRPLVEGVRISKEREV